MDLKAMFPNLNTMWARWSAYEITEYHGVSYLMPAAGAEAFTYNCAEQAETLVADALDLGRQIIEDAPDTNRACAAFAVRHGLLGLGGGKDGPFSKGDVAPCYRPVNEKEYGEELERLKAEFQTLYRHFLSTRGGPPAACDEMPTISGGLRYKLTSGQTPQLVWEVDSLLNVLRLAHAAIITGPGASLKVCKNCGKVYYNAHAKSEFCEAKCRNYYNVRAFRERAREPEGTQ